MKIVLLVVALILTAASGNAAEFNACKYTTGSGRIKASSNFITGYGTRFRSEVKRWDYIVFPGGSAQVIGIASDEFLVTTYVAETGDVPVRYLIVGCRVYLPLLSHPHH